MSVYKISSQYGTIYKTTRRHIPEECTVDSRRRVNLRSHVSFFIKTNRCTLCNYGNVKID
jgi:hypothetical protein